MNKNKFLVLLNTITLAIMLFCNFAAGSGVLTDVSVAEVSYKYNTLFAPAGYAFSIWGFIFLLCTCFVIFQWTLLKTNDPKKHIERTGVWFALSNIANSLWLYCWTNEMMLTSVIVIIILLLTLIKLTMQLRLELNDEPVKTIFFVWWPIAFYLGWMMVATVANIAAYLVSADWSGGNIKEDIWTIVMIAVATILYFILVRKRNLRESAAVGIWAFVAIAVRQWSDHNNISIAAVIASVVLFIVTSIHAYKNSYYSIARKIKRNEWK